MSDVTQINSIIALLAHATAINLSYARETRLRSVGIGSASRLWVCLKAIHSIQSWR